MQTQSQSILSRNPIASKLILDAQCTEWKKQRIISLESRIKRVKHMINISEDGHNHVRNRDLLSLNAQLASLTGKHLSI